MYFSKMEAPILVMTHREIMSWDVKISILEQNMQSGSSSVLSQSTQDRERLQWRFETYPNRRGEKTH